MNFLWFEEAHLTRAIRPLVKVSCSKDILQAVLKLCMLQLMSELLFSKSTTPADTRNVLQLIRLVTDTLTHCIDNMATTLAAQPLQPELDLLLPAAATASYLIQMLYIRMASFSAVTINDPHAFVQASRAGDWCNPYLQFTSHLLSELGRYNKYRFSRDMRTFLVYIATSPLPTPRVYGRCKCKNYIIKPNTCQELPVNAVSLGQQYTKQQCCASVSTV